MIFDNNIVIALLLTLIAGGATGIGSIISLLSNKFNKKNLCFYLGLSAGVMIFISFVELLPEAISRVGFLKANLMFFAGMLFIMLLDYLIPHEYIGERCRMKKYNKKLMTCGIFTAIGIAIHNFPEGIAIMIGSLEDLSLGVSLAFAVAIHNIPEGIAIATPIYFATKDRGKAFWLSLFSGLTEPLGAIIALVILYPFLSENLLAYSLAFVAGIMVFISFDELLPLSFKDNKGHLSMVGIIIGMMIMSVSLYLF